MAGRTARTSAWCPESSNPGQPGCTGRNAPVSSHVFGLDWLCQRRSMAKANSLLGQPWGQVEKQSRCRSPSAPSALSPSRSPPQRRLFLQLWAVGFGACKAMKQAHEFGSFAQTWTQTLQTKRRATLVPSGDHCCFCGSKPILHRVNESNGLQSPGGFGSRGVPEVSSTGVKKKPKPSKHWATGPLGHGTGKRCAWAGRSCTGRSRASATFRPESAL